MAIKNQQSVIIDEPSGWHVGFDKRELAAELTGRMGWKHSSYGVEAIYNNPMNTEQIADILGALDQRDAEIVRLVKVSQEMFRLLRHFNRGGTEPSDKKLAEWQKKISEAARGTCLYCGFSPCRCDEVNAVADGLRRKGVTITD